MLRTILALGIKSMFNACSTEKNLFCTIRRWLLLVPALLLLFALFGSTYHKDVTIPAGIAGQHIEVNGSKLRYLQQGKGQDVVFLHGSIGNLEDFETVAPLLAHYRITNFDRIGHGYSDNTTVKATIENNARYAEALIKKLQLHDVILVGHSYGGSVALQMALNRQVSIKGLVLIAPAAYTGYDTRWIEHVFASPLVGVGLLRLLQPLIAEKMLDKGLHAAVAPNPPLLPENFFSQRVKLWNNTGVLIARTQQTVSFNADLARMSPHYTQLQLPVTVLVGDRDFSAEIQRDAQQLIKDIPQAKLVMIPGSGHYVQYHAPHIVVNAIQLLNSNNNVIPAAMPESSHK